MTMFLLSFTVLLNILIFEPISGCGQFPIPKSQKEIDGFLIGAEEATEGQWPWMLSVQNNTEAGAQHHCGASLIYLNWAVTSASCVIDIDTGFVVAGEYDFGISSGNEQQIPFTQSHVYTHPDFNNSFPFANDIALIYLSPAVQETSSVSTVCLPPYEDRIYVDNPHCFIAGWGKTAVDGNLPDILHHSSADILRNNLCSQREFPGLSLLDTQTCIQNEREVNRAQCFGDEGGPLHCMIDAKFELASIMSYHQPDCDVVNPSLGTTISLYLDWINSVTGNIYK